MVSAPMESAVVAGDVILKIALRGRAGGYYGGSDPAEGEEKDTFGPVEAFSAELSGPEGEDVLV